VIAAAKLSDELSAYVAANASEESSLARLRELLSRAADPFTRANPEHVTGSAVIARPDGMAFLLVYHRRLDRWLQPGGHVEPPDESVLATALREAREETGISSLDIAHGRRILDLDVHPVPAAPDRPAHVHYDLRYLATTSDDALAVAADEIRAARWFTLEEALAAGVDDSLARALRKASSSLASGRPLS
jgi:8-oxo-dGTP pyrophosphatase MutT (NUDIX family)